MAALGAAMFSDLGARNTASLNVYESERRLLILNMYQAQKDELLAHLSLSLAKFLAGRLSHIAYVTLSHPQEVMRILPQVKPIEQEKKKRYYTHGLSPKHEADLEQRARLIINTKRLSQENLEGIFARHWQGGLRAEAEAKKALRRKLLATAQELDVDYILAGLIYRPYDDKSILAYGFFLCDAVSGHIFVHSLGTSSSEPYNLASLVEFAEGIFWADNMLLFSLDSVKGAHVYLDESYLGTAPLTKHRVLAGSYHLRLVHEGYKSLSKKILLKAGQNTQLFLDMQPITHKASLEVESEPPGAEVYLNMQYLGQSPLRRKALPEGKHRLRVYKKNYIERHITLVLDAKNTPKIKLKLQRGDTLSYYQEQNFLIGKLTYSQAALASSGATALMFAGWLFFNSKAQQIRDEDAIAQERGVQSPSGSAKAQRQSRQNAQYAQISAALAGFSLASGIYFLYKHWQFKAKRNFGESSFLLPLEHTKPAKRSGNTQALSALKLDFLRNQGQDHNSKHMQNYNLRLSYSLYF